MVEIDERTQIAPDGTRVTPKELRRARARHAAQGGDKARDALLREMIRMLEQQAGKYESEKNITTLAEALDFIKVLRKDMTMLMRGLGDLASLELGRDD